MQRMVHANIESVNLSRKEQRAEDRAKLRAMQERLNSWVDQIESRVNQVSKKVKQELRAS